MNLSNFIPMKPYKLKDGDISKLTHYPYIAQPKYDGIRCVMWQGEALSYSLKPIRNKYIRRTLETTFKDTGMILIDGELMLEDRRATFQDIQSAVNSYDGEPRFRYVVFDSATTQADLIGLGFYLRHYLFDCRMYPHVENAINIKCNHDGDVLMAEATVLTWGYEGLILRAAYNSPYKFGRSTRREGSLLALKRFVDAEATVIARYPLLRNYNEAEINKHGHTERSTHAANLHEDSTRIGGLVVRGINGRFKGVKFNIGSGFTDKQRVELMSMDIGDVPDIVKYKYQDIGSKDKPRQPIFLGFRNKEDM